VQVTASITTQEVPEQVTEIREVARPWTVYKKSDGSRDQIYEPGWAGTLDDDEVERLQNALTNDADLARWWGWRPSMKRRSLAAIERAAAYGDPDNRAHNVMLVREFFRRPKEGSESDSAKVKQSVGQAPARPGRRRIETWESDLLRMASSGMGVKTIAKALRGQGVEISHATVANRLRELQGQLTLIM
jgi:hypothetical protein